MAALFLTTLLAPWDNERIEARVKTVLRPIVLAVALLGGVALAQSAAHARTLPAPQATNAVSSVSSSRADAYYGLTMGHISELRYEATGGSEYASQAIEFYKKAYALDPHSNVIGERLAEMYWEAQRTQEAIAGAQEVLKRNPDDLPTRRLLGRIYLRSLGDQGAAQGQSEAVTQGIEQFREILRLDPADVESALWLARLYRLQNEHEKAGQVLRDVLKQDPDNEPALQQLSQLFLDQGKAKEAITLLENASRDSSSASLVDVLGDACLQAKDYTRAAEAYGRAVELDPAEPRHYRGLAQALMYMEKYPEALAAYKKLNELDPDDAEVYLRLSQVYRELHQLDLAEENLLKARQRAPGDLEITYNEAILYRAQGRFDDAIRILSDAVAGVRAQSNALPSQAHALAVLYQQLGQLYREVQNYAAAVSSFQEMYRLGDEEERNGRLLVMDTYGSAKDLQHALEEADQAIAKYPKEQSFRISKALLLGEKGDTDAGIDILRALLTGTEADREVYLNMAQVYERGRRYAEAESSARLAEKLAVEPQENETTSFLLGAIYERQKLYDRAEQEFKRALALDPRNAAVLNYYGYMLGDLGIRLDEAHSLIDRALAEDPYNGAYLDSLGWVAYKQGHLNEAESALRKAVERESHDPTIHGHLGDVYFKIGRTALAAQEWEKSLAEWSHALPTEVESDKISETEAKLASLKRHLAQEKAGSGEVKPQ
jgi:tetratricopeptide (TPR) repeat protein